MLKQVKNEMELLPHGTLRCTSSNGCYQFFIDGKYISKEKMDFIHGVAQREYYERLIPILENHMERMKEVQNMYEEQLLENCYEVIADALYRYHVPYHYEKPLILEDWGKEIVVRPDFTVMNPSNGKIYIYEHLGMMDNPEYVEKNMSKLDLYEKNGFLLGKNLIMTHETSKKPLVVGVVDNYIENFLI